MLKILLVLSGITLISMMDSDSYSDSNELNVPIDEIEINPGEKLVILDTTGTGIINLLSISANLPCNSGNGSTIGAYNDYPDLKIKIGTLDNLIDFISAPEDDPGYSELTNLCIFQDNTIPPADNIPTLTTIVLTNDGNEPVLIPDGGSITINSMIHPIDAAKIINVTKVRNHYNGTYEIPGEPGQQNTVDIEYVIGSSSTVKIDIVDLANDSIVNSTNDIVKDPGIHTWNATWIWKNAPDSYAVRAYFKSDSTYILNDEVLGFVNADKITQGVDGWTPNMYTRAVKTPLGSDYSVFNFKYWYWDNTHNQNPDQGTPRLTSLKSRMQEGSSPGKFVTEFRRDANVYDAGYQDAFGICVIYAWNSNLPSPQVEIEENDCWLNPNGTDEEFEVYTTEDDSILINSGGDPTGERTQGYFSEVTMYRRSLGTPVNLFMEFELEEFFGDSLFDIIEATKQAEIG